MSGATEMRYTGKEYDEEDGINQYYFGARFLHETMLRFTSVDPRAEKYPGLRPYVYAAANPVRNYDPDGEEYVVVSRNDFGKSINRMAKEKLGIPGWMTDILLPEEPELGIGPMAMSSGPGKLIGRVAKSIIGHTPEKTESLAKRLYRTVFEKAFTRTSIERDVIQSTKLLEGCRIVKHHLFPEQYRRYFSRLGIEIDQFTVSIGEITHLRGLHGKGFGRMPGRWNQRWGDIINNMPNATAKDIYQQLGKMMDEYGLSGLSIEPYK
jgi:RHS repeat-associated protein